MLSNIACMSAPHLTAVPHHGGEAGEVGAPQVELQDEVIAPLHHQARDLPHSGLVEDGPISHGDSPN